MFRHAWILGVAFVAATSGCATAENVFEQDLVNSWASDFAGPCTSAPFIDTSLVDFIPRRDFALISLNPGAIADSGAAIVEITNLKNGAEDAAELSPDGSVTLTLPGFGNTAWNGRTEFEITFVSERGERLAEAVFDTGASWIATRNAKESGITFEYLRLCSEQVQIDIKPELIDLVPRRDFAFLRVSPGGVETPAATRVEIVNLKNGAEDVATLSPDGSVMLTLPGFSNTAWSGRTEFHITFTNDQGTVLAQALFDTGASWIAASNAQDIGLSFE